MAIGDIVKEPRVALRHPGVIIDSEGHSSPMVTIMGELPNGTLVPCGMKNNGDGTYSVMVDAKFEVESITIGAVNLQDGSGSPVNKGQAARAASLPFALSTEDAALIQAFIDRLGALTNPASGSANASLAAIAKRYTQPSSASISVAAAGDATIIAAPSAGNQIIIYSMFMTCLVNNITILKSGSTEIGRAYVFGFAKDYISGLPLGEAKAFVITPATADPIYGQVVYKVEAL